MLRIELPRMPSESPSGDDDSRPLPDAAGKCRVLGVLATHGDTTVCRGRHDDLDVDVTVHFIDLERGQTDEMRDEMRGEMLRQVQGSARLSLPTLARVIDCGVVGEWLLYIALECVEGADADAYVSANGPLPSGRVLDIVAALTGALRYAQAQFGMVHGAIEPGAVRLAVSGGVQLRGLGLSSIIASPAEAIPSMAYRGPEQLADVSDARLQSDMYGLGATAHFLLSGRAPFEARTRVALVEEVMRAEPPPLPKTVPFLLRRMITHMMAKHAANRPADYDELLRLIDQARVEAGAPGAEARAPGRADALVAADARGEAQRRCEYCDEAVPDARQRLCPACDLPVTAGDSFTVQPDREQILAGRLRAAHARMRRAAHRHVHPPADWLAWLGDRVRLRCPHCRALRKRGPGFCESCWAFLGTACPSCAEAVRWGTQRCGYCDIHLGYSHDGSSRTPAWAMPED